MIPETRAALPPDVDEISSRYIAALADEIRKWLLGVEREPNGSAPVRADDLLASAAKFDAAREDIVALLERTGMLAAPPAQ